MPRRCPARPLRLLGLVSAAVLVAARAAACPLEAESGELLLAAQPEPFRAEVLGLRGLAFPDPVPLACGDYVFAVVRFDRPPDAVFALLTRTDRQGEYLSPSVTNVLRADGESVDEYRLRVLFTKLVYQLHHRWDRDRLRIAWSLATGFEHDVRELTGWWQLYAMSGDFTLGVYAVHLDVGPLVPAAMQAAMTHNRIRESIGHLRRWVESDGRHRR